MHVAIGPWWVTVEPASELESPCKDIRPKVHLIPEIPQKADGIRIDPPPSLPIPNGTSPLETAAPVPLELPPV